MTRVYCSSGYHCAVVNGRCACCGKAVRVVYV